MACFASPRPNSPKLGAFFTKFCLTHVAQSKLLKTRVIFRKVLPEPRCRAQTPSLCTKAMPRHSASRYFPYSFKKNLALEFFCSQIYITIPHEFFIS
jgi:hypothetical protein